MIIRTTRKHPVQPQAAIPRTKSETLLRLVRGDDQKGRPEGRAMAANLRGRIEPDWPSAVQGEEGRLAGSVGNCGERNHRFFSDMTERVDVFHCSRGLLCDHCAAYLAKKNALLDAARVMTAYEADPSLRFLMLTLTVAKTRDLEAQLDLLWRSLKRLPKRRRGAWAELLGMIWRIEIARGSFGGWWCHVHVIVATRDTTEEFQFALLRQWIAETQGPLDGTDLTRTLENQHSQIFFSCRPGPLTTAPDVFSLGLDAKRISLYAAKPASLSIDQKVEAFATVWARRLRQPTGVFHGLGPDLKARAEAFGQALFIRREPGTPWVAHEWPDRFARSLERLKQKRAWEKRVDDHLVGSGLVQPGVEAPNRRAPVVQQGAREHVAGAPRPTGMAVTSCHCPPLPRPACPGMAGSVSRVWGSTRRPATPAGVEEVPVPSAPCLPRPSSPPGSARPSARGAGSSRSRPP